MKRQAVVCLIVALSALYELPVTEGYCDSSRTNKFGPLCEYTCHCRYQQARRCSEDGTCSYNECQDGYFGKRCQYRNIAAGLTNASFIDSNVDTCNLNVMSEVSVYGETTPFNFTWLRVSGNWSTLQSLTMDWEDTDGSVVPCTNLVKRRVVYGSDWYNTIDFDCPDISKPINRIVLKGTIGRYELCSTYMSDKRNCPAGWYGPKCQYKCRCSMEFECQDDGTCVSSCQKGWFGPACQYSDIAYKATGATGSTRLTDGDDSTCENVYSGYPTTVQTGIDFRFTWMRISGDTKVPAVSVEFKKDSQTLPCSNVLKSTVSENVVDIRCENATLTIDRVTLSVSGQTSICSVHISGGRYIGLEQDARQSTVAYDGYAQNDEYFHYSCSHTIQYEDFSWWEVSLKTPVIPSTYKLYNRDRYQCRLTQFNVSSYYDTSRRGQQYWGDSTQQIVTMDSGTSEPVNSVNITFSKVNRCRETYTLITLCEVEIYGEPATQCPLGRYGRECELACQCSQPSEPCYVSTGMCASGCPAGYMGEGCWTECGRGRWGKDCSQFCSINCISGTCDRVTGECDGGCTRGFLPPNCEDGCGPGYHSYNCTERCSTSCYNRLCNALTGVCDSCIAGYQTDYCDQECPAKTWGKVCKEVCDGRCVDQLCHHVNGTCNDCQPGKEGDLCENDCEDFAYGSRCVHQCSGKCSRDVPCDKRDGSCPDGCTSGYLGENCDQQCPAKTWGKDCKEACDGRCVDQLCHHISGTCDDCQPGKEGDLCEQDCEDFTYGSRCVHQCSGKCSGDVPCDKRDGNCLGGCISGYLGQFCDQQCPNNTYGLNCSNTCSPTCVRRTTSSSASDTPRRCHHEAGACLYGCLEGYEGVRCSESDNEDIQVGAIVGLVMVIILLIGALVTILLYRKRRKAQKESNSPQNDAVSMDTADAENKTKQNPYENQENTDDAKPQVETSQASKGPSHTAQPVTDVDTSTYCNEESVYEML